MPSPNIDSEHLGRLRDYYADYRHIPSLQRVADLLGFGSKGATSKLMERLESAGFVERAEDGAWIPTDQFFERPLVNATVQAGAPEDIECVGADPFFVDSYLVRRPSRTVMVTVKGDSMVDAGIHDGDIVVVERGSPAVPGDFVVAIVDNEFTLKELGVERGKFILKPHNKAYPVIRPRDELEIFGVVVSLARRYKG